jgi:hypothetical protein
VGAAQYVRHGDQGGDGAGPFELKELERQAVRGELTLDHQVRTENETTWQRAGDDRLLAIVYPRIEGNGASGAVPDGDELREVRRDGKKHLFQPHRQPYNS